MKGKTARVIACAFALVLTLILAVFFAACTDPSPEPDPDPDPNPGGGGTTPATVTELIVDTPPSTTEYYIGEAFDPTGMVIKAKWSDGLTVNVAINDCTITPSGPFSASDKSVTITYEGKSVTQSVTVLSAEMESLSVDTGNTALKAAVNTAMDFSGMVVTAHYSDGGSRVIGGGYAFEVDGEEVSDVSALTFADWGTHTLSVVYGDLRSDITLTIFDGIIVEAENIIDAEEVTEDTVNYVEIYKASPSGAPYPRSQPNEPASGGAYMGSVFNGSVIRFHIFAEEACYADVILRASSAYMLVDGGAWSPMEIGDQQFNRLFEVSYGSAADAASGGLERLYVEDDVILEGGSTDKPGGEPLLYVNWKDVNFGTLPLAEGDNIIELNVITDYVNCKGENVACNIDRLEVQYTDNYTPPATATSLTIKTPPTKTEYNSGETFDPAGMVVEAAMSDGSTVNVDADDLTIAPSGALTVNDTKVTISYRGASAEQPITVRRAQSLTIEGENIYATNAITADMKNYVERYAGTGNPSNALAEGASGGKFLGTVIHGSVIRFHIWADAAGEADITLRLASTDIVTGGWSPTEIGDSQLNRYVAFKFGAADALVDVTVADTVVLPGSTSDTGSLALLENWCDVDLGTFDFVAGDNILEITVINENVNPQTGEANGCNIDNLVVDFA